MMKAARAGHVEVCAFLIQNGACVNKNTTNNDHTPLSLACAGGHLPVVELLLQHGADPYYRLKVIENESKPTCDAVKERVYFDDRTTRPW
jgi:ankyrin repeat protein